MIKAAMAPWSISSGSPLQFVRPQPLVGAWTAVVEAQAPLALPCGPALRPCTALATLPAADAADIRRISTLAIGIRFVANLLHYVCSQFQNPTSPLSNAVSMRTLMQMWINVLLSSHAARL